MLFSHILYQIELLFPFDKEPNQEPEFIVLCKLHSDPCISVGEKIDVPKWSLGYKEGITYKEKDYTFNVTVVGIKREIHLPSSKSEGTFAVRYFVEAEDRDLILEMSELIKNNNL